MLHFYSRIEFRKKVQFSKKVILFAYQYTIYNLFSILSFGFPRSQDERASMNWRKSIILKEFEKRNKKFLKPLYLGNHATNKVIQIINIIRCIWQHTIFSNYSLLWEFIWVLVLRVTSPSRVNSSLVTGASMGQGSSKKKKTWGLGQHRASTPAAT